MAEPRSSHDIASAVAALLDRALDHASLREATEHVARDASSQQSLAQAMFVFRLGAEWLGLATSIVDEVVEPRIIHALPHRREGVVRGLVNVRGQLTICVALEQLFQLGAGARPARTRQGPLGRRLVVLASQGHRVAFEADEVHGAYRFDPASLSNVPATVSHAVASFTTGVLPWGDRSIGQLDSELVFHAINRRLG